jgi:hypothetical protein
LFGKFSVTKSNMREWIRMNLPVTATAVDPAGGTNPGEYKKGIRDWCCIISAGRDRRGLIHVFSVKLTKDPPDKQIDILLDEYDYWRTKRIGVEEVMFKNLYKPNIKAQAQKKKLYPNVVTFKAPRVNKQARILGVQPQLMDLPQQVVFADYLFAEVPEFFAMFDEFPAGMDDGPDATEMVVRMLEKAKVKAIPQGVGGSSYWKGRAAS